MSTGGEALHPIERTILKVLSASQTGSIESLSKITGLDIDQVRRGIEWLKFKNLVSVIESSTITASLSESGIMAAESGLPERRLVDAIGNDGATLGEVVTSGKVQKDEA